MLAPTVYPVGERAAWPWKRSSERAMASSDLDVVVRRSGRKRNAAWKETLNLSIRASRTVGSGDTVPVKTRGGRPAHKKKGQMSKTTKARNAQAGFLFVLYVGTST